MENASSALKMAFAVFIFVVAISVLFSLLAKIKETADIVLFYADKTNYYEWKSGTLKNGRVVGEETVISSLYNQSDDLTYVYIKKGNTQIYPRKDARTIQTIIEEELSEGATYLERIIEVTIDGKYIQADDGTRITVRPGTSKTYIIYTKQ